LVDFYTDTQISGWSNDTGWFTTPDVDAWFGVTTSGTNVTELVLNANLLNGTIPASFNALTELTYVNLRDNNILDTGTGLPQLAKLETLYL
jgi:hypothetical protein